MNSRSNRFATNGAMDQLGPIWETIMPPPADEMLDDIVHRAYEDGLSGRKTVDKEGLGAAIRLRLAKVKLTTMAECRPLRTEISALAARITRMREKVEKLRGNIENSKTRVRLIEALIFSTAALFYILGDLVFSHQLILVNWGLGMASVIIWLPLVLALGMAPVYGELVYSRFVEAKYDEAGKVQPRIIKWFFAVTTGLMGLAFLYFGYVRGIGFRFQVLESGRDVYEALYAAHPHLNTGAFIALALMFLVGGSVLLSVGIRKWRKWFFYRSEKRDLKRLQESNNGMDIRLWQLERDFNQAEALATFLEDSRRFGEILEDQVKLLTKIYDANYARGLQVMLIDVDNSKLLRGKFHLLAEKVAGQRAVSDIVNSYIRMENRNGR